MLCILCILLALLTAMPVYAQTEAFPGPAMLLARFDDDGYDGAWVSADDLSIEFFLPDGWTGAAFDEDGVSGYRARSADGAVTLSVTAMGELPRGQSVAQWAAERVPGAAFEAAQVGGQAGAVAALADGLFVVAPCSGKAYGFDFRFAPPDAITEEMALAIAGSCTDLW